MKKHEQPTSRLGKMLNVFAGNNFLKRNPYWNVMALLIMLMSATLAEASEFNVSFAQNSNMQSLQKHFSDCDLFEGGNLFTPSDSRSLTPDGLRFVSKKTNEHALATLKLKVSRFAGKRVTIKAEVKRNITVGRKYQGGKLMLCCKSNGKVEWPGVCMIPGDFGWQKFTLAYNIPSDAESIHLVLGIQDGVGEITYRSLSISTDTFVDLRNAANLGFADDVAGDGKGGWSDQGSNNDASGFDYTKKTYGGIPFQILNPKATGNKSVVTFRSPRFSNGVEQVVCPVTCSKTDGKYLYLLHTLTWGSAEKGTVGFVDVVGVNNQVMMTIPVRGRQDVGDWWNANKRPNGFPAASWKNKAGEIVSLYASRFKLDENLGGISEIRFRSANPSSIWILVAATISEKKYVFPNTQVTITEGAEWGLPAKRTQPAGIQKNSALDLSPFFAAQPVEETGRVIVNKKGLLAFSSAPDKPVRFLGETILRAPFFGFRQDAKELTGKEATEAYVEQLSRAGYNIMRFHFMDDNIMSGAKADLEFNPKVQEQFDYLVACLKKKGIYVCLDAMSRRIGYSHGNNWSPDKEDARLYKFDIYFDPAVRENWAKGITKFLAHVNPYTGMALKDDPVLALIVAFNEQEFAWTRNKNLSKARQDWQRFLRNKYKTIDALTASWKPEVAYHGFEDIPAPPSTARNSDALAGPVGRDFSEFIYENESKLLKWYIATLRKTGTTALITNYNVGQDLLRMGVRKYGDFIAMNAYHAHPAGNVTDPRSSIAKAGQIMRSFASTQESGKPYFITEHGHGFWNPYRYEQGFIMGAYASLQNMSGLIAFANAITNQEKSLQQPIRTFLLKTDPILKAQEIVTAFAFRRSDVAASSHTIYYTLDTKSAIERMISSDGMSRAQSCAALVSRIAVDVDSGAVRKKGDIHYPICGNNPISFHKGYQQSADSKAMPDQFRFDTLIQEMKVKKFVPSTNKSKYEAEAFESETGELFLDAMRSFMRVNTPRMQGICALAGAREKLQDVEISRMTTDGNLVVIAIDQLQPIYSAKRILIVYATNALNRNMNFEDDSYRTMLASGEYPCLLRKGAFSLTIQNVRAKEFKVYALGPDGSRVAEIPAELKGKSIHLNIDTNKLSTGVSIYFELVRSLAHEQPSGGISSY